MSRQHIDVDLLAWIGRSEPDSYNRFERQAITITLHAVAISQHLSKILYLKGGILMGIAYGSPRQTVDIDISATQELTPTLETLCKV